MRQIKVLGPGCKRCMDTMELVSTVAQRLGVEASIEKVTDYAEIARHGVMSTPGVVIDGIVVHAGGMPSEEAVVSWLKKG